MEVREERVRHFSHHAILSLRVSHAVSDRSGLHLPYPPKYITSTKFITYQHCVKQHPLCLSLSISRSLALSHHHCSNHLQKCSLGLCSHNGRRLNSFIYPLSQVDGSGSWFAVNKLRKSFLITVWASCSADMNRILMPPVTWSWTSMDGWREWMWVVNTLCLLSYYKEQRNKTAWYRLHTGIHR